MIPRAAVTVRDSRAAIYDTAAFLLDFRGGMRACAVTVPLSLGVAVCSGVSAERGLYSAAIGGFVVSLISSEAEVVGPSILFIVVVSGLVAQQGLEALALCTCLAGFFLGFLHWAGLSESLARLPECARLATRSGLALAAIGPITEIMGAGPANGLVLGLVCLALSIVGLRSRGGVGLAVIVGTAAAWVLNLTTPTLVGAARFFAGPPAVGLPHLGFAEVERLILPSLAMAVLTAAEPFRARNEGVATPSALAMGVANLATSLVGGIPVTMGFLRERAGMRSNCHTPVAGIVHAVALLASLRLAGVLGGIPVAVLCGIVLAEIGREGWPSSEWLRRASRSEAATWLLIVLAFVTLSLAPAVLVASFAGVALVARQGRGPRANYGSWVH